MFNITASAQKKKDYTTYVNPFIGTGGKGKTNPGAMLPYAMLQVNPVTDMTSGDSDYKPRYKFTDSLIYGFAIKHLSGFKYESLYDMVLMPTTGEPKFDTQNKSKFIKKTEVASPGYYAVKLDKYDIGVEFTATNRAALQRFIYPSIQQANLFIDLKGYDSSGIDQSVEIINNLEIRGYIGFYQRVFFYIKFSKPFKKYWVEEKGQFKEGLKQNDSDATKLCLQFDNPGELLVKTGLSVTGTDGAKKNLDAEIPGFDFKTTLKNAKAAWMNELAKIDVEGGAPSIETRQMVANTIDAAYKQPAGKKVPPIDYAKIKRQILYTALYHSMLTPNIHSDVDGKYRGPYKLKLTSDEDRTYQTPGITYYTFNNRFGGNIDAVRDQFQLLGLIDQKRAVELIDGFLMVYDKRDSIYNQVSRSVFIETAYQLTPLIVELYAKGNRSFNAEKALSAMKYAKDMDANFSDLYKTTGLGSSAFLVSYTMQYAYTDWCIAQMAKMLQKPVDYNNYIKQAQYWQNIHNVKTGFMQARNWDWKQPFEPEKNGKDGGTALPGNGWQYAFAAPYDINTLIARNGGKEKFATKLEEVFTTPSKIKSDDLIGEYDHSVAAARTMPYLFNFTDEADKTQFYVHRIMSELYTDKPEGLLDDQGGNVSAWYVMSALGLYNISPGVAQYQVGLPQFEKAVINLENGKKFTILNAASSVERNNIYLQGMNLDKKSYNKIFVNYADIAKGGDFEVFAGRLPNKIFMQDLEKATSAITDNLIVPSPIIVLLQTFAPPAAVEIRSNDVEPNQFYYTTDGSDPTTSSVLYSKPIPLTAGIKTIKAIAVKNGKQSMVTQFTIDNK
ncbi:MAG: glycoside hydrolase domain-containing protein [Bacteroidota bacterium]